MSNPANSSIQAASHDKIVAQQTTLVSGDLRTALSSASPDSHEFRSAANALDRGTKRSVFLMSESDGQGEAEQRCGQQKEYGKRANQGDAAVQQSGFGWRLLNRFRGAFKSFGIRHQPQASDSDHAAHSQQMDTVKTGVRDRFRAEV